MRFVPARVLAQQWISADGMASGPHDEFELFATAPAESAEATEAHNLALMADVDTVVLGRRSYESFRAFWPTSDNPMADDVNGLPKVVCSTSLTEAPWGDHAACRVVHDAVAWAREYRGGDGRTAVLWGSLAVMRALLAAGQIDELELFVTPALLGAGVPVHGTGEPIPMTLTAAERWPGGLVRLRYDVDGAREPALPAGAGRSALSDD